MCLTLCTLLLLRGGHTTTYRSGEGEAVLLRAAGAGFVLVGLEPQFESFLLTALI